MAKDWAVADWYKTVEELYAAGYKKAPADAVARFNYAVDLSKEMITHQVTRGHHPSVQLLLDETLDTVLTDKLARRLYHATCMWAEQDQTRQTFPETWSQRFEDCLTRSTAQQELLTTLLPDFDGNWDAAIDLVDSLCKSEH